MAPTVPLRCPWRWLLDANWTQISVVWAAPNKINETLATLSRKVPSTELERAQYA
jgi:hypothetical protein